MCVVLMIIILWYGVMKAFVDLANSVERQELWLQSLFVSGRRNFLP